MKTTLARPGCLLVLTLFIYNAVFSQSPILLSFTGTPTVTGTAGTVGAKYTYPNIGTTGGITIKAVVEITANTGGATLASIDDNSNGSDNAFQPSIYGSQTTGNFWGISFRISFYDASNSAPLSLSSFRASGIDIDGASALREFNTFSYPSSYTLNNPTGITVTNTSGVYKFLAPITSYAGISITQTDVAVTCLYTNRTFIDIQIGSQCVGGACSATSASPRLHSINFFDAVAYGSPLITLPVKLTNFTANKLSMGVLLTWTSAEESNLSHYTVQRSGDGTNFSNIAVLVARGNNSTYNYTDSSSLQNRSVYYRIKSADIDGGYSFSRIVQVKNETIETEFLSVSPNPVINDLYVTIKSGKKQDIQLRLISAEGKPVRSLIQHVIQGVNSFSIENTRSLPKGIYYLQAIAADGSVNSRKVIVQ
jgi:hypothetical protein